MSLWSRPVATCLLTCGLFCVASVQGQEGAPPVGRLPDDVTEKVVDGKTVVVVNDQEWPVARPATVFASPAHFPSAKEHGYLLYQRNASDEVFETSAPRRGEKVEALETIITPGEKRHVQFAIHATKDLDNVRISIADLVSGEKNAIGGEAVDVRVVKSVYRRARENHCHRVPHLLVKQEDAPALAGGRTRQFWLTVAVPDNTPPGTYRGKIELSTADGPAGDVELRVEVPGFALVEGMSWGMYYYGGWNGNITRRLFEDMLDHGLNTIMYGDGKIHPLVERVGDRAVLDFRAADQCMPLLKKLGFKHVVYYPRLLSNKLIMRFGMEEDFEPHSYYSTKTVLYKAEQYPESLKPVLKDVFRQIDEHAREAGWPYPLIYYPVDEPHYRDAVMEWALVEMPILKEALPDARIFCTAYELDVIQALLPWLDIVTTEMKYLSDEETQKAILASAREKGAEVWGIFWMTPWDDYQYMRTKAGLLAEKGEAAGMTLWAYYGPYDHKDDYDELRLHTYAVPSFIGRDGTLLPTLPWEAIREGINDSRYFRTLRYWIEEVRKQAGPMSREKRRSARLLADDAAAFLMTTMDGIPWGEHTQMGKWTELDADNVRREAARRILALKEAVAPQP